MSNQIMSDKFPKPSGDCITDRMRQHAAEAKGEQMSDNIKSSGPVSDVEQAEAFLAWKRREPVEMWAGTYWKPLVQDHSLMSDCLIRRRPQPKFRPWNNNEVPVDAWYRKKECTDKRIAYRPVGFFESCGNFYVEFLHGGTFNALALFADFEHSTDGGKTWKPCGVPE